MAVTGNTQLTATKNDLIVSLVQRELIESSKLLQSARDVSMFAVKGAQSISFPKAGNFTVENRASAASASIADLIYTVDKMDLDFRANVSWVIDPNDEIEASFDVQAENAQRAARAQGKFIDTQLAAELETVGVPITAGAITKDLVLEMREDLQERQADPAKLWLAVGPDSEAILLGIADFIRADAYGSSAIPSGVLGKLYGVQVLVTPVVSALGANTFFMYESDGIAIGFQRGLIMDQQKDIQFGAGAMLNILEQKFGVQGLQLGQQGVGGALSALVVKDGN